MNPDQIPDLHWNLSSTYTTNNGQIASQITYMSTHYIDVDTLSHAKGNRCGNWCGITLNTDTITLQSNTEPDICSVIPINKHEV